MFDEIKTIKMMKKLEERERVSSLHLERLQANPLRAVPPVGSLFTLKWM